ncbi:SUMF1/EgtB/PvdO family nonheme iron enzyme [Fluviicola sp.]|uniref:formylglycine-generating enzyme family protein n=1 Tax=Fluviicola sp. TaxID=1917219 RepID=UPI0031DE1F80
MKHIFIGLTFLTCFHSFAQKDGQANQKPETVYSIAKEERGIKWYEDQLKLWKAEVDKNPGDGNAWSNYYAAARALRNTTPHDSEQRKKYRDLCAQIPAEVQKAMPNTFEGYFIPFIENEGAWGNPEGLLKAAAIDPDDPRLLDEMLIHFAMERNQEQFDLYGQKMFAINELPVGLLNWGYNVMSELDENAVLFTCGDNDTYAAWIMQAVKKMRKDVTVVNTSLIELEGYRNRLLKELGYPPLTLKEATTDEEYLQNKDKIYRHFFQGKRPVYVATTAINQFEKGFGDKLYLTGLAYKYSESNFDNTTVIRRNYEKRYLLDYLKEVFACNIGDLKAMEFNGMYVPSMIKLYQHYDESEETLKKQNLELLLLKVAEQSGQQSEVIELLSSREKPASILSAVLDLKTLENNMVPVSGNVYMDKYEVTNGDYNRFLNNLKLSGQTELYQVALYDSTQWVQGKYAISFNDPMKDMYHWHPAYKNYPAVCMSYEGAKAYCEWLTKQYNLQRKRTYTQVVFRLPTEKEWRTAAGSGDPKAITPFPNNQIKTCDKCYLGNIRTSNDRFFEDGGFHQVKVHSYDPNKMGFFNTLGNVSEMTSSKGKALGGSWYDLFEDCTFDKTQSYSNPDPTVGFRVVMEIIEK